jgi:hypothetical protein
MWHAAEEGEGQPGVHIRKRRSLADPAFAARRRPLLGALKAYTSVDAYSSV